MTYPAESVLPAASQGRGASTVGSSATVAAYYDENTQPFYLDRWHPEDIHFGLFGSGADRRDHHSAVKRMTQSIVSPARIAAGERVLDAGCGVGGAALDVARTFGADVVGVTISQVQVDLGTERAVEAGLSSSVRFEVGDCSTRLPPDDASIDVVVSIEAACHFDDKRGFLRECRRVLRDGGRVAFSDWMAADGLADADRAAALDPVCDAWRLAGMASLSEWRGMFAEAGFNVRESVDYGDDVMPNATILARARLDLMLEVANRSHEPERARLWQAQYDTLVHAWVGRQFTIGRIFAVAA